VVIVGLSTGSEVGLSLDCRSERPTAPGQIGQRHFDVQLIGGIVLHQGKIAEMSRRGQDARRDAACAYLNALTGPRRLRRHRQRLPGQA
jgi:hypothetical protein